MEEEDELLEDNHGFYTESFHKLGDLKKFVSIIKL